MVQLWEMRSRVEHFNYRQGREDAFTFYQAWKVKGYAI